MDTTLLTARHPQWALHFPKDRHEQHPLPNENIGNTEKQAVDQIKIANTFTKNHTVLHLLYVAGLLGDALLLILRYSTLVPQHKGRITDLSDFLEMVLFGTRKPLISQ
ncbi:hypothetical protein DPMN_167325 [Dreissena polymorpha]|uniref:Uncharacterized protein n=1 Tax=Dreissena polymorpha TaxID=45954 RepID=A0A9D4IYP2_DREPO|nr:hypothetical protein DPMN_167325 [Dreissena polymorpha]